ncbi:PREDICTED: uncharacterized protein At1g15400-like isoform X2 [Camelina sativa]|uniref:Uncharacterized protein At1g15400-like isoform X1 n=1 Tax=Camelina sativa TaxID=90675 RepID=A0ABM0WLX2_CAMSA|nr:PREDICTED: uncharacterized protein At1g15400-like isoform X1 [Camelina sativa]XP_010472975.1 PREDICTED: uncharacterized protein At1g15400-like isoform X2 [Camelina sativa]
MAGLQRSTISFRRQGSSGIVWDDRLIAELSQQANDQKGETQPQGGDELHAAKLMITSGGEEQTTAKSIAGEGLQPIRTDHGGAVGGLERSRSNGGGAIRHHRNTGRVSPAVDPPSPRLSAFGCCSAFGKKPPGKKVSQRKRPTKRRSR